MESEVARLGVLERPRARALQEVLAPWKLQILYVGEDADIPFSFWGAPEAGLRTATLYVRADTPINSVLHEASHFRCMDATRRESLDTDAGGDDLEECAVCYLSVLIASLIPDYGLSSMLHDMDIWGYSFRLGSARAWFEQDAEDAVTWLRERQIIGTKNEFL
ncbi:MAG: hypothetical protein EXR86_16070 [Gammaproteobacteria bacterium]|nr:hypothetical protein [Gammaproteobacteria bacterium]